MIKIGTYEYSNKQPIRIVKIIHQDDLIDGYHFVIRSEQEEQNWLNWKTEDKFWEYKWK